jgi:transcriptional regulator GlxA family with amidase domain
MIPREMQPMNQKRCVSILIFEEVEVLDFCGPFEVFSVTGGRQGLKPFDVCTVAEEEKPVRARGGLSVNPAHSFDSCPRPDILLIPGGTGTRREMNNPRMLQWLRRQAESAELVLSVCSGALVLGKAGLLNGLEATTHHDALDELRAIHPAIAVDGQKRFSLITDASLYRRESQRASICHCMLWPGCWAESRPSKQPGTWNTSGSQRAHR